MRTGWVYLEGDPENSSKSSIADWRYFAESGIQNATVGAAISGWLSLNPPEQLQDNVDEPVVWYYFDKTVSQRPDRKTEKRPRAILSASMERRISSTRKEIRSKIKEGTDRIDQRIYVLLL